MPSFEGYQTLLVILAPFIYTQSKALYDGYKSRSRPSFTVSKSTRRARLFVASLSCGFFLIKLLVFTPTSIFTSVGLPFNAPTSTLVERLANKRSFIADSTAVSTQMQLSDAILALLTKLKTLDGRILYQCIGPVPLVDCEFCKDGLDYKLYLLPGLLGIYALAFTAIGLLTIDSGRDTRRNWFVVILATAFAADFGSLFASIDKEIFLPFYTHIARNTLFLFSTLSAYLIPPPALPEPQLAKQLLPALTAISRDQAQTSDTLSFLAVQRAASLRDPQLRQSVVAFWEQIEREAGVANANADVQAVIEEMQLNQHRVKREDESGNDRIEGEERQAARQWTKEQMSLLSILDQHSHQHTHSQT